MIIKQVSNIKFLDIYGVLSNIPMGARLWIEYLMYTGKYVRRYVALIPKRYKTLFFLFQLYENFYSVHSYFRNCLMSNGECSCTWASFFLRINELECRTLKNSWTAPTHLQGREKENKALHSQLDFTLTSNAKILFDKYRWMLEKLTRLLWNDLRLYVCAD